MPTQIETKPHLREPFLVEGWRVEPTLNRLMKGESFVQLEHKAMDVLLCLAAHAGEVVTKHELLDAVWQTEFVSDNTLQRRIAELRDAFGDDALDPRYIETIRKRGYRMIAEMGPVRDEVDAATMIPDNPTPPDDENPYPGLSAFTEEDAELFFGRETETAALWRTITSRRLLAVIGPSGIGKSSLLRAGVASRPPPGWRVVVFTPGESPTLAMARALAPDHAGDPAAVSKLVGITDPDIALAVVSRWRGRFDGAVLVVDQFEELFTLNQPEIQASFVELLRRLVDAADVHIVLAMRDDFLYQCQRFPAIAPIFKDLTPVGPPRADALRRALTEPAARRLHRFESEVLVDRMVTEVENQRSALPLLAFAVHRLWEKRDRENRLLTETAYESIGGVAGALARHAEETMDRIGNERIPIVREIFRNLVTAEGTRAVRGVDELLSVFDDSGGEGMKPSPTTIAPLSTRQSFGAGLTPARETATEVLRVLIDARLLTTFENRDEQESSSSRVEIVHESLLSAWPRMVRWQTQDADAAQLRDQLRQAARTWHERCRTDDLLWTGSAYHEYLIWREHYPGGLSQHEEAFGEAMISHATRRRRLRRVTITSMFITLLAVLGIIGGLWQRSVSETHRAEAANLFSLGQLHINDQHSFALAYAIASLELADSPDVRRLALEALSRGPTVRLLQTQSPYAVDFSPGGRWMATATEEGGGTLWPSDGGSPTRLEDCNVAMEVKISPRGDLVAATMDTNRRTLGFWTVPEGRFVRSLHLGDDGPTVSFSFSKDGKRLLTTTETTTTGHAGLELDVRSWPVSGGDPVELASLVLPSSSLLSGSTLDSNGSRLAWADGREVHIANLDGLNLHPSPSTTIVHEQTIAFVAFDEEGLRLATSDTAGLVQIWSLERETPELMRSFLGGGGTRATSLLFEPSGSRIIFGGGYLWDLSTPPDAVPLRLSAPAGGWGLAFHPDGNWLALGGWQAVVLWPLNHEVPLAFRGHEALIYDLAFTPDGDNLISVSDDGSTRLWPIGSKPDRRSRILHQVEGVWASPFRLAMAPDGSFVVSGSRDGRFTVVPLDGVAVQEIHSFTDVIDAVAIGPNSRLVAAGSGHYDPAQALVQVLDLETGVTSILDAGDGERISRLDFTDNGALWVASGSALRRWRLNGSHPQAVDLIDLSALGFTSEDLEDLDVDSFNALVGKADAHSICNLKSGELRELPSHNGRGWCRFGSRSEIVLSSDETGGVRVGPATGEIPHLLLGHEDRASSATESPDGRWIATGGDDFTIRLWPMPDLTKPPLHTLPREELIAKLKTLTNLRVVRDPESSTGWKLSHDPFPGWETVPTW